MTTAESIARPAATRQYLPLAIMLAYLVGVRLLIGSKPDLFRSSSQAAVFSWPMLAVVAALAVLGTVLSRRSRLPDMWDPGVSLSLRIGAPAAAGLVLGIIAIAIDRMTGWTALVAAKMHLPSIHISWPASLAIYPGGAIIVSVLYYLFLIPLLLAPFRGRGFWVVGLLTAAIEPLTQDLHTGAALWVAALVFAEDYVLNLGQVWLFRRAGFVSAVLLRVFFYVVWHMVWPAIS